MVPLLPTDDGKEGKPWGDQRRIINGILWQLRHTIVHNVGVITQSDAIKLRLLVRSAVPPMRVIAPTRDDIRYLKRCLKEAETPKNRGRKPSIQTAKVALTCESDTGVRRGGGERG